MAATTKTRIPSVSAAVKNAHSILRRDYTGEKEVALEDWKRAQRILIDAGFCPECAGTYGDWTRLGKFQPGNAFESAGRECMECEEFYASDEQPMFESGCYEYSDADPGL